MISLSVSPVANSSTACVICLCLDSASGPLVLTTDIRIKLTDWNGETFTGSNRNIRAAIDASRKRLQHIADSAAPSAAVADIARAYRDYVRSLSLRRFMSSLISGLNNAGRHRTAETYRSALNSFIRFLGDKDILLDLIDADLMERYQAWMRSNGLVPNSISFYLRILRAVYNRAVDSLTIPDLKPFRRVFTGVERTRKRALPLENLRAIKSLDLTAKPGLDFARDVFLLSFYLRGMSFVDLCFLRKSDLRNGCLNYCRRKTGRRLSIGWTPEMDRILRKYPSNPTELLLPLLIDPAADRRRAYITLGNRINASLKTIARMANMTGSLTLYSARHSWASIANANGVPISIISEGMGHDSQHTTQIYLASLESTAIDRANSMIINLI